jgi:hypothetical protein
MFATWPLAPLLADSSSWGFAAAPEVRATDFSAGPHSEKPRFDRLHHTADFSVLMTGEDFNLFRSWFVLTLHYGADKFTLPVWDGETYSAATVRFEQPYSAAYVSQELMRVSFRLIALDLPIIDDAALYLLSLYGGDFIIAWANALHYEVHVHYPSIWVDQATWWMLANYSTDFIISFHQQLHTEVHVHYPSVWPLPAYP